MKRERIKKIIRVATIITATASLVGFIGYHLFEEDIPDNGKAYSSKATLCQQFAQSYLRTVQNTYDITNFDSEEWKMAIDVETDMYNLCLTDLTREALRNYKASAIEKYQK